MNLFSEIDVPSHSKRVYLLIQWYIFGLDYNFISRLSSTFYPGQPWNRNMWNWWCHYEKKYSGLKDSTVEGSLAIGEHKWYYWPNLSWRRHLYTIKPTLTSVYWTRGLLQSEHLSGNFYLLVVSLISFVDLQTLITQHSQYWAMISEVTRVTGVTGVCHHQCKPDDQA